jgi:hypothetical protein
MAKRARPHWVLPIWVGCHGGGDPGANDSVSPAALIPEVRDAGNLVSFDLDATAPESPLLGNWCVRSVSDAADPVRALADVADAYLAVQRDVCPRLTGALTPGQLSSFRTYIYDYTSVMAGCGNATRPPPGGILAFGPANTPAVGADPGPLSEADARVLTDAYVTVFAQAFGLDGADRALVEAHIERSARAAIDPGLPSLSLCASVNDAG